MNVARQDPWWHELRPEEVVDRVKDLPSSEQQAIISEIKAAAASMSMRSQDKTLTPLERSRAMHALKWTVQKKRLLAALASRTNGEGYDHKRERVETMIEAAEQAEDPREAIRLLAATMRAMWNLE